MNVEYIAASRIGKKWSAVAKLTVTDGEKTCLRGVQLCLAALDVHVDRLGIDYWANMVGQKNYAGQAPEYQEFLITDMQYARLVDLGRVRELKIVTGGDLEEALARVDYDPAWQRTVKELWESDANSVWGLTGL